MLDHQLTPGATIAGRYTIRRLLGTGATGAVWLAEKLDGSTVACKILHPHLTSNPQVVLKLEREANILSQLTHGGITRHFELNTEGPFVFLVIEYVDGIPLHEVLGDHVQRGYHLPGHQVRRLFNCLCDAIAHAHSKQIVHRDVKPQNIMVVSTPDGPTVKVLDFGHARLLEDNIFDATTYGRRSGSPLYMAPEQTRGQPASVQSDVFALATVLFEIVTLHRVWVRDHNDRPLIAFACPAPAGTNNLPAVMGRIRDGIRPRAHQLRAELSSDLDEVFDRALAIDPRDRPSTVAELQDAAWPALMKLEDEPSPVVLSTPIAQPERPTNDSVHVPTSPLEPSLTHDLTTSTNEFAAEYASEMVVAMNSDGELINPQVGLNIQWHPAGPSAGPTAETVKPKTDHRRRAEVVRTPGLSRRPGKAAGYYDIAATQVTRQPKLAVTLNQGKEPRPEDGVSPPSNRSSLPRRQRKSDVVWAVIVAVAWLMGLAIGVLHTDFGL